MKNMILLGWIYILLIGCATPPFYMSTTLNKVEDCKYNNIEGRELIFSESTADLQRFGYQFWCPAPTSIAFCGPIVYEALSGKKGKIQTQPIKTTYGLWYEVTLETCEKVYTHFTAGLNHSPRTIDDLIESSVYFTDTLAKTKSLIGKSVWVNNALAYKQELITSDPVVSFPLSHLEQLTVVGVETKRFGHGKGGGAFYLR